ncbi:MAG: ATP-dependent DNA helicase RecG [Bacteroidota bacterium]
MSIFFQTKIEFLRGVGPSKAALLQQELQIETFDDLLQHLPFRYEDRTQLHTIATLREDLPYVQLRGSIHCIKSVGTGRKRLTASLKDQTGEVKLVWFRKIQWIRGQLQPDATYVVFGKPTVYRGQVCLIHPELTTTAHQQALSQPILPVYHTTEKLKAHHLDSKGISKLQQNLLRRLPPSVAEAVPEYLRQRHKIIGKRGALLNIHFPESHERLQQARFRFKFEELFYIQLRLLQLRQVRLEKYVGEVFNELSLLKQFYHSGLPFGLTQAQKRAVREIYQDLQSGNQMNRLLQGDVGSGKTIVAFLSMLIVLGSGGQVAMMAPTEILAEQHYRGLQRFADSVDIRIAMLTGSTKPSERSELLAALGQGSLQILIGTHALISDVVAFKNLGLAIIDEQHRFGVAQRAKLSQKNQSYMPHVLIMTATPIPRTLAMTLYGDLDVSVIDTMPVGRKPVRTLHCYDAQRLRVLRFVREQIAQGRQAYMIYPLIEESEQLDYKNLLDGYESICRAFPTIPISMIHSKMRPADKDHEMQRFVKGETKIMVSTTVIEVGIDVLNATVVVIENAEYFGLAQLHQLRGRVGRGSEQAYCILMTDHKLNEKSRTRIDTMVRTNDGFRIADVDLQLRGPGDLIGVQQSGVLGLKIADLSKDGEILQAAREAAKQVIYQDPALIKPEHAGVKAKLDTIGSHTHP